MAALMYQTPFLYELIVRLLHGSYKEYELVAGLAEGRSVLDLACGTGLIARYLPKETKYEGWELNEKFLKHGRKKGLDVRKNDLFDINNEKRKWDVIILKDVLHHVHPKEKELLRMLKGKAKYAIVCEPVLERKRAKDIIFGSKAFNFVHYLFGDFDSFNHVDAGRGFQKEYDKAKLIEEIAKIGKIVMVKQHKEMVIVKAIIF